MHTEIKIVHICTLDRGGAAIAALRLHAGLLKIGVKSTFLCLKIAGNRNREQVFEYTTPGKRTTVLNRLRRRMGLPTTIRQRNELSLKGLEGTYEFFSFPVTDYLVENHPLVQSADIINLHWIANFVNYPTFFQHIKQPIVWTFHDENPFLGGFHYQGDKIRNASFSDLEEGLTLLKKRAVEIHNNITIVTPSRWLGEIVARDNLFRKMRYRHIAYSLDTTLFKLHDQRFARNVFNLPLDKKIFLFVSDSVVNYRKGFDLLIEALANIQSDTVLVTIGDYNHEFESTRRVVALGKIMDERLLSLVYSAVDLFVLPSREDNLPNVMLESLVCGTPVVAFANGGMLDVIEPGENGILVDKISSKDLANALNQFLAGEYFFDRKLIAERASHKFELSLQATRYKALYDEILANESNRSPDRN